MKMRYFPVLLTLGLFGCFNSSDSFSTETGKELFSYRPLSKKEVTYQSLDPKDFLKEAGEELSVQSFKIEREEFPPVTGYIFSDAGSSNGDGLLLIHWLGGSARKDKNILEFYSEAAYLASQGFTCILPQGYFPWDSYVQGNEKDADAVKKQIIMLRLSLDLLQLQDSVKSEKVGVIAHDYGAMHAIALAAADTRIRFMALMAFIGEYWEWNRILTRIPDGEKLDNYKKAFALYEPEKYLGDISVPLLLQFGDSDEYITNERRDQIFSLSPESADRRIYSCGHDLNNNETASDDRLTWVLKQYK